MDNEKATAHYEEKLDNLYSNVTVGFIMILLSLLFLFTMNRVNIDTKTQEVIKVCSER